MGFTQNIFANTLFHTNTQLIALKTRFRSQALLTKERILILSSLARKLLLKTRLKMPITLRPIALRHSMQRKKCDNFWLPGVENFPTIYNMNDFAVMICSRFYTLNHKIIYDGAKNCLLGRTSKRDRY